MSAAVASAWHAHATQRTASGIAGPRSIRKQMEWTTTPGHGPGAEVLGPDLRSKRILELGCGPGHNAAYLAAKEGAEVTGVDLVRLQILRARTRYGHLHNLEFVAANGVRFLNTAVGAYGAIYSVFGAVGLVAPERILPVIVERLVPDGVLAFAVPHPHRVSGSAPCGDKPRRDHVTLPDRSRLPIARWDLSIDQWEKRLNQVGLEVSLVEEFNDPRMVRPTTLLIRARRP